MLVNENIGWGIQHALIRPHSLHFERHNLVNDSVVFSILRPIVRSNTSEVGRWCGKFDQLYVQRTHNQCPGYEVLKYFATCTISLFSGIMFVVDSSCPEHIGAATIHLVELLNYPGIDTSTTSVLVIFTKTDVKSTRTVSELKAIMRLEHISSNCGKPIQHKTFNQDTKDNLNDIFDWCMQFRAIQ